MRRLVFLLLFLLIIAVSVTQIIVFFHVQGGVLEYTHDSPPAGVQWRAGTTPYALALLSATLLCAGAVVAALVARARDPQLDLGFPVSSAKPLVYAILCQGAGVLTWAYASNPGAAPFVLQTASDILLPISLAFLVSYYALRHKYKLGAWVGVAYVFLGGLVALFPIFGTVRSEAEAATASPSVAASIAYPLSTLLKSGALLFLDTALARRRSLVLHWVRFVRTKAVEEALEKNLLALPLAVNEDDYVADLDARRRPTRSSAAAAAAAAPQAARSSRAPVIYTHKNQAKTHPFNLGLYFGIGQLVLVLVCFWVDVLPRVGASDGLSDFASRVGTSFAYFVQGHNISEHNRFLHLLDFAAFVVSSLVFWMVCCWFILPSSAALLISVRVLAVPISAVAAAVLNVIGVHIVPDARHTSVPFAIVSIFIICGGIAIFFHYENEFKSAKKRPSLNDMYTPHRLARSSRYVPPDALVGSPQTPLL